jgi:hypothetical protein
VTHNDHPQFKTHPEQNEAVFFFRMIRIEELHGILIGKRRSRLFEGNAVLFEIGPFLRGIPLESNLVHAYNVHMA